MCFGNTLGFLLGASKDIASSVLALMGLKDKLDEEHMVDGCWWLFSNTFTSQLWLDEGEVEGNGNE